MVTRRAESLSAIKFWFCDRFSRLTANCEISFLAMEKIEKHRELKNRKMFQIQVFSKKLKICVESEKKNIFPHLNG
jgi:hypothetical protein